MIWTRRFVPTLKNAQDTILEHWVREALADPSIELAVPDTQIRPHRAQAKLQSLGISVHQVVLVACEQEEREEGCAGRAPNRTWPIRRWRSGPPICAGRRTRLGCISTSDEPFAASLARLRGLTEQLRTLWLRAKRALLTLG